MRTCFEWRKGFVDVDGVTDLEVSGLEWEVTFSPREITITGIEVVPQEYIRPKQKNVYLIFDSPLEGESRNGNCTKDTTRKEVGLYDVRYTRLDNVSYYLTIIPLHGALYDYVVLTPDELYVSTISRRKTFLQKQNGENIVYLV